jgi:hypothetical protein
LERLFGPGAPHFLANTAALFLGNMTEKPTQKFLSKQVHAGLKILKKKKTLMVFICF